jgi:drug/metabolite transporter (DMT)-like permease
VADGRGDRLHHAGADEHRQRRWFSIVGLLPANVAGLSSIMVPVVAMVSGAIVHGEPLGPLQWLAIAFTVAALSLALLRPAGR